ncbi:MAG: DUF1592 domain-containing protein [Mariniblastus sp.]
MTVRRIFQSLIVTTVVAAGFFVANSVQPKSENSSDAGLIKSSRQRLNKVVLSNALPAEFAPVVAAETGGSKVRTKRLDPVKPKTQPVSEIAPRTGQQNPNDLPLDQKFTKTIRPFLEAYCLDCHTGDDAESDFDLDKFESPEDIEKDLEAWSHVLARIERGDMPPADCDQPSKPAKKFIQEWILDSIDASKSNSPSLGRIRRLNRVEYENTVRDLFRLSRNCFSNPARIIQTTDYFKPATKKMPRYAFAVSYFYNSHRRHSDLAGVSTLPVDPPVEHGFSNDQEALSLSPLLMENYFEVATALLNSEEFDLISGIWDSMFLCDEDASVESQLEQANQQLTNFLPRAFRRPVSKTELNRYVNLFKTELAESNSYTESMKTTVSAILVSPNFLFRREFQTPKETDAGAMDQNFANASRLSYFLWGSMPDDILFQAAREKRLVSPSDLSLQVDRMMDDKRIKSLATDFGMQWLKMKKVASVLPDGNKFPKYFENRLLPPISISMMIEQLLLFETIMVENRSVVDFVNADFGYLNRHLMNWYQIDPKKALGYTPKIEEFEDFFRVKWPNKHFGGITSGAMLISTSTTTRTSPVYRGAWVLDVLFNSPPPPAPPNIPQLQEPGTEKKVFINVREKLEAHREDSACAACHDLIDPMGFAFEKYDAIGRWRKAYETGDPIDPTGTYGGFDFNGVAMFKVAVTRDQTRFVRAFIEHTMKYALGRKLHYSDQPEIRRLTQKVLSQESRFRSVIKAVVMSEMFRQELKPASVNNVGRARVDAASQPNSKSKREKSSRR